jgi:hypothetical protein
MWQRARSQEKYMSNQADIAVYGPDEHVRLVAEVKAIRGASTEWAAQLRRNLLMHGFIPNAPYFLLATPDRFYLWKDGKPDQDAVPPDYEVETAKLLASYIERLGISLADLSEPGFELLVISWLHDLIDFDRSRDDAHSADHWLFDSGLYEALKHGSVVLPVGA